MGGKKEEGVVRVRKKCICVGGIGLFACSKKVFFFCVKRCKGKAETFQV